MTNGNKPSAVFWVVGVVALVWNILGVAAYLGQQYMTEEALAELPQGDQDFYANVPAWVTAAFAIAVFAGFIASIGLLMRKKWAISLFMLSLLAVLVQNVYSFFMQDYIELSGSRMFMPIVVIILSAFFVWYSKDARSKGILT